jgi:hypothetical protein
LLHRFQGTLQQSSILAPVLLAIGAVETASFPGLAQCRNKAAVRDDEVLLRTLDAIEQTQL